MHESREQRILRVLSGEDRSIAAATLRGALAAAEPFYATAMRARNRLYDAGNFKSHKLPRPTISVGNITTGGTGKTPVVRWLADRLIEQKLRPAVLTRGYRANRAIGSDEAQELAVALGDRGCVIVNPDRVAAALHAMHEFRQPDVFILDDGFQHRRAARDLNLVLINAANAFGFGHVLPRGLLREPLTGLRRADAVILTRADRASDELLRELPSLLAAGTPIYHAYHHLAGLRDAEGKRTPIDELSRHRFALMCAIGDPASLEKQLRAYGENFVASHVFADHHAYRASDLEAMDRSKFDLLVTTEKDWVKLDAQTRKMLPIRRLLLEIRFREGDRERLLTQVMEKIRAPASSPMGA
jgi:tetraacyldisaccharide 4'-kinase